MKQHKGHNCGVLTVELRLSQPGNDPLEGDPLKVYQRMKRKPPYFSNTMPTEKITVEEKFNDFCFQTR